MNKQMCLSLANEINKSIRNEFETLHLTGNLMDTVEVGSGKDGSVYVYIPARIYDMVKYFYNHVMIYTSGSYASELDTNGSKIFKKVLGNHTGYLSKCINEGVTSWAQKNNLNIKIE